MLSVHCVVAGHPGRLCSSTTPHDPTTCCKFHFVDYLNMMNDPSVSTGTKGPSVEYRP